MLISMTNGMASLDKTQKALFCKDGLMLKANKPIEYVDERWDKMTRRVMFLLKDKNTLDGDDTRLWLIDEQNGANNRRLPGGKVGKKLDFCRTLRECSMAC